MIKNERMLTAWSEKYVSVYFKSELARDPHRGRFRNQFERDAFIKAIATRGLAAVKVEPLADGFGVRITGANPGNLLAVVRLAQQCGGEVLFPGALPG